MHWTVKLVAEVEPGQVTEHTISSLERRGQIMPATLGLSIAEGRTVLATIQAHVAMDHARRHGQISAPYETCGRQRTSKGDYRSTFRSVFGTVPMRVRRFNTCPCQPGGPQTVSALFTGKYPVAPELREHGATDKSRITVLSDSLPDYGTRYRTGAPISTAFAESAVNEIISKRMIKKQQMRWNRDTVQPFLTVRVAVLNGALAPAFRSWHVGFQPAEAPTAPQAA